MSSFGVFVITNNFIRSQQKSIFELESQSKHNMKSESDPVHFEPTSQFFIQSVLKL